jgi:predicted nucleotidyltransferase
MKTERKIIGFLLDRGKGEKGWTIRRISKGVGADYKIVHTAVKMLEKKGLIRKRSVGGFSEILLSARAFSIELFSAEHERRERLLRKNSDVMVLWKRLAGLQFPFVALVFGSVAKGTATKTSDIDLLVVREKNRESEIQRTVSLLPYDIHLIGLAPEEFLNMAKSREFTVVSEAMNRNIILIGIEEYYRLVTHD